MLDFVRPKRSSSRKTGSPKEPAVVTLDLACGPAVVRIRRNNRARRMTLRHDAATGDAVLTLPRHAALEAALDFLDSHRGWIAERRRRHGPGIPFQPGAIIPLRDRLHEIAAGARLRGIVHVDDSDRDEPRIVVPGGPDHLARRLTDWLKREARRDIARSVKIHAETLEVAPSKIMIRDQKSRWGSCSSNGTLAFSWRLILAPPFVLDYVAAHEVAHLVEMNHAPAFWRTLRSTSADVDRAEAWLKAHGTRLHRYGRH